MSLRLRNNHFSRALKNCSVGILIHSSRDALAILQYQNHIENGISKTIFVRICFFFAERKNTSSMLMELEYL